MAQHLHAALVEGTVFFDDFQAVRGAELQEPPCRRAGAHYCPHALEQGPDFVHAVHVGLGQVQVVEARALYGARFVLHARLRIAHHTDRSPYREIREPLQALERRLRQQRHRLYPPRLHQALYLVDVKEGRDRQPPRAHPPPPLPPPPPPNPPPRGGEKRGGPPPPRGPPPPPGGGGPPLFSTSTR